MWMQGLCATCFKVSYPEEAITMSGASVPVAKLPLNMDWAGLGLAAKLAIWLAIIVGAHCPWNERSFFAYATQLWCQSEFRCVLGGMAFTIVQLVHYAGTVVGRTYVTDTIFKGEG